MKLWLAGYNHTCWQFFLLAVVHVIAPFGPNLQLIASPFKSLHEKSVAAHLWLGTRIGLLSRSVVVHWKVENLCWDWWLDFYQSVQNIIAVMASAFKLHAENLSLATLSRKLNFGQASKEIPCHLHCMALSFKTSFLSLGENSVAAQSVHDCSCLICTAFPAVVYLSTG